MKQRIYLGLAIALLTGIGLLVYLSHPETVSPVEQVGEASGPDAQREAIIPEGEQIIGPDITNFEECAETTNLILTTYPAKCMAPGGKVFVNPDSVFVEIVEEAEVLPEEPDKTK